MCETDNDMNGSVVDPGAGAPLPPVTMTSEMLVQLLAQPGAEATGAITRARSMKIRDAESFTGDATQIPTLLSQCQRKFCEYHQATDTQKIIYQNNKMKGSAGKWIPPAIEANTYNTWKEFTNALTKVLGESDTQKTAKMHNKALRQ